MIKNKKTKLVEEFNCFDSWIDKYNYIIELGYKLEQFPENKKTPDNFIKGCQSNLWLYSYKIDNILYINAISDSLIVNGLIFITLLSYNKKPPSEILSTNPDFINELGLNSHLTSNRINGLNILINKIKSIAENELNE